MARRTNPAKKQKIELVVVRRSDLGAAVVLFAKLRGQDIYAGADEQRSVLALRASYHSGGSQQLHTPFGQMPPARCAPPQRIAGVQELFQSNTSAGRWDYSVKEDSSHRRTLILDDADYPNGACVTALAVEAGRQDLVSELATGRAFERSKVDVAASLMADWVSPFIVVLALVQRPGMIEAMRRRIAADGGDPDEKLDGFVLGGNPARLQWEMMGTIDADGKPVRTEGRSQTLWHRGVLFLDEFPEFSGKALEALREPLESGVVTISRARGSATFPAQILLVAAMNPCPCGYYGDSRHACSCTEATVSRYQHRVSGPLLDRFDLFFDVPSVEYAELVGAPTGDRSEVVRDRVIAARAVQARRLASTEAVTNSEMAPVEVGRFCHDRLDDDARPLLASASERLGLSARSFHRVLRVSRTIADLDGAETIGTAHLAEAIQYRRRGTD